MHQYKTIAQTLLVLSILNLVFAAPIPRDTDNPPGGTTPSQYASSLSGGLHPHDLFPLEGSARSQVSAPSSGSGGSVTSSHYLSATDMQVPAQDSTMEAPTSAHPLSAESGPGPVPDSITEASTSSSSHRSSATDTRPVPVHGSTADGSTTHTAVTYDMVRKATPFYMKKKFVASGVGAVIAALLAGYVWFIQASKEQATKGN